MVESEEFKVGDLARVSAESGFEEYRGLLGRVISSSGSGLSRVRFSGGQIEILEGEFAGTTTTYALLVKLSPLEQLALCAGEEA